MKNFLYAPWRDTYINKKKKPSCVFCDISKSNDLDEENFVLYRDEICFIVMNKYPYTPGHFMIIPHIHTDKLETLDNKHWMHISNLAQKSIIVLKQSCKAQGINMGMNLGDFSGAGIAEHIHLHFVPRWKGDLNFMTSIANTRVYSKDFLKTYNKIKDVLGNIF